MEVLADIARRVVRAADLAEDEHRTAIRDGLQENGTVNDITVASLSAMIEAVMTQAALFYPAVSDLRAALARLSNEKTEARACTAFIGSLRGLKIDDLSKGSDAVNLVQGDLMRNFAFLMHLAEALNLAHSDRSSD